MRRAFVHALRGLHAPNPAADVTAERAWKLFLLVPRLLLARPHEAGAAGRAALLERIRAFEAGCWRELLEAAPSPEQRLQRSAGADAGRLRERACAQVRRGQLSDRDGAAIDVARRRKQQRYPELAGPGPQRLVVLTVEVGGRSGQEAHDLVRDLAQQRPLRAPRALRAAARSGWERRWWGQLGCALQRALASTLLGGCWRAPAQPTGDEGTPLGWVLELAEAEQPSRLPLRA